MKTTIKVLIIMIFIASPAFAEPKPWEFGWWPGHYDRVFNRQFNPHLENGKHPHNNQYFGKEWFAEDWLAQYENDLDLINNFYEADIFHGQDEDDGVPVLIVGPNFYRLSGYDKRRVTHVLDVVYNITDGHEAGMFRLDDWRTDNPIGFYTEQGLQIQ